MRVEEFVILSGIFVTSIFWLAGAVIPFEVPKVVFFQYFVKILTLFFAFIFLRKHKEWNINKNLTIAILVFIVWTVISSILGVDAVKSFVGNYYRKDGLITLYHLIGFSFLISFFWRSDLKRKLSLTFFVSSVFLSVLTFYEIITHKFGLGTAATFGNPNFLAGYFVVCLPFGFYLFKESTKKVYLLGILFVSLMLFLIGANAAILTLILFLILYSLFFIGNRFKKLIIFSLAVLSIVIVSVWARSYYVENSKSLVAEGRVRIVVNVLIGFSKRPILGYGWGNVDYAFESGNWPLKFNNDVYVDKAHSEILEILVTTGIPGLIIYITFVGLLFNRIRFEKDKLWKFTLLSLLILYLFHAQTHITSIAEQMIFWVVVGIIL